MRLADVSFESRDGVVVARLTGEVDMSNARDISMALVESVTNQAIGLVVDLTAVTYLDSAGIHLLYKVRESLLTRGQDLRLVLDETSPAEAALRLSGVANHITWVTTLDEAIGSMPQG